MFALGVIITILIELLAIGIYGAIISSKKIRKL